MSRASLRLGASLSLPAGATAREFASRPLGRSWDAANPTAYWTGNASAYVHRPPPRSNRWLLHPWMPIDIRLPALAGVLGAAAYIYLERSQAVPAAQARARGAWDAYVVPVRDAVGGLVASVTGKRGASGTDEAVTDSLPSDAPLGHPAVDAAPDAAGALCDLASALACGEYRACHAALLHGMHHNRLFDRPHSCLPVLQPPRRQQIHRDHAQSVREPRLCCR